MYKCISVPTTWNFFFSFAALGPLCNCPAFAADVISLLMVLSCPLPAREVWHAVDTSLEI